MARLVCGARGTGKVLVNDGYKYHFNRASNTAYHWQCWQRQCRAKLTTDVFDRESVAPDINIVYNQDHNHEDDGSVVERGAFSNSVKRKISHDPTNPIKRVYDAEVSGIHRHGGGDREIPTFASMRSQMSRAKARRLPPVPHDIDDVDVQGHWATSWRNKRFLLRQDNEWGILIFATDRNLRAFSDCEIFYMDGTFRTAPRPYQQVFTILGEYHGRVLPLVVATMTNREVGDYRQVLQVLKQEVRRVTHHRWNPRNIVCDFEQALITAVETDLPASTIEGCYFHFNQSLWRHVCEFGLTRPYRIDERLKRLIRKVMAIGFLPVAIVRNNFLLLWNSNLTRRLVQRYPELMEFLEYVFNTYINGRFPIPLWNVYERNMDCRTNNNAEGKCCWFLFYLLVCDQ